MPSKRLQRAEIIHEWVRVQAQYPSPRHSLELGYLSVGGGAQKTAEMGRGEQGRVEAAGSRQLGPG